MSDRPDLDEFAAKMQAGGWKITGGKYAPQEQPDSQDLQPKTDWKKIEDMPFIIQDDEIQKEAKQ